MSANYSYCVETLEHVVTIPRPNSYLEILQYLVDDRVREGPKAKALFATSGISHVLSEILNEDKI